VFLKEKNLFVMTSKKRSNNKTSNYLISMGQKDHYRDSDNILAKVRSNFMGTEFLIFDAGANPKVNEWNFGVEVTDRIRNELGAVLYTSNILGNRGPRRMQACISKVGPDGKTIRAWPSSNEDNNMIELFKKMDSSAMPDLVSLVNRPPRWNDAVGAYVLNFSGRVTMASVKNFQLVDEENTENVILQVSIQRQLLVCCTIAAHPYLTLALALLYFRFSLAEWQRTNSQWIFGGRCLLSRHLLLL